MDKSVINILGYVKSKNRLYGLDKNKQAVVMSEDNGLTWVTVSKNYYLTEKTAPGFIPAKVVPWNVQIANTPVVQGAFNGWLCIEEVVCRRTIDTINIINYYG